MMHTRFLPLAAPSLSVLMSVYNGGRHVLQAVESILNQTLAAFEFVIVDDGSTDETPSILAACASRDMRIHILSQANGGLAQARNRALAQAQGDLIAHMDADDVAHPDRLLVQTGVFQKRSSLLALGSQVHLIDETGVRLGACPFPTGVDAVRRHLALGSPLAHSTAMMRRDEVLAVGGYREACRYAEDYDLWLRLSERGEIDNLAETLVDYRVHSAQVSHTRAYAQSRAAALALESARDRAAGLVDPLEDEASAQAIVRRSRYLWTFSYFRFAALSGSRESNPGAQLRYLAAIHRHGVWSRQSGLGRAQLLRDVARTLIDHARKREFSPLWRLIVPLPRVLESQGLGEALRLIVRSLGRRLAKIARLR